MGDRGTKDPVRGRRTRVIALADLIEESIADWNAELEMVLFETADPAEIAQLIVEHVTRSLARPVSAVFYRPGVGIVVGLELEDGRRVVLKIHRWNVTHQRLANIQRVQALFADQSLPAPRPLDPPTRLGNGLATVEEFLDGHDADGHQPQVRHSLVSSLHDLVNAARSLPPIDVGTPALLRPPDAALWPEPHALRFDFDATSEGAEWIDAAAHRARQTLQDTVAGSPLVAHFDWRTENLGFAGDDVVAIYDWDALGVADEAVVVGVTAAQFCSNWRLQHPVATVEEMRQFVDEYERLRQRPFDAVERQRLDAANLALIAYGARCQHADMRLYPEIGGTEQDSWIGLLNARPARVWA